MLDLYAASVDYDPRSEDSIEFFKIVQNKLHFAAHGHTAAEVIYERADSEKPFMGLTTFSGELPALKDISIAKNDSHLCGSAGLRRCGDAVERRQGVMVSISERNNQKIDR